MQLIQVLICDRIQLTVKHTGVACGVSGFQTVTVKQELDFDLLDHVSSGWIAGKSAITFLIFSIYPTRVGMLGLD